VAFCVIVVCFVVQAFLAAANHDIRGHELWVDVFIPQVLTTMAVATLVFQQLKDISVFFKLKI